MPRGPIDFELLNNLKPDALFEVLCRQFEMAWRAGRAPSIETILERLPSVSPSRLVTTLAVREFKIRCQLGDEPKVHEYLHRFPQFAADLSDQLSVSLFAPNGPVGSTVNLADSAYGKKLAARANLKETGIGRYRVDGLLGMGASGEVWKGYDSELLRPVAIKLLRADRCSSPDAERNFLDEGRKLAQLKHPGIVSIYDLGTSDGNYFLVSEYVDGGTLDERLKRSAITINESVRIIAEIAEAVHYAHRHDIVHRDVKPQNILLANDGTARLADFGMAVTEEQQLLEEASIRGTLSYMSPEQLRGDSHLADARSDIYSLGAVLYLMLAGRLPFLAQSLSQLREQALNREPRPLRTINDQLPPALEQICLKCLRLQPGDRYTTALDLAKDLRATIAPQAEPTRHRRWLAVPVAVLAIAALGWSLIGSGKPTGGGGGTNLTGIPHFFSEPSSTGNADHTATKPLMDATVAADGSAQFRTIGAALNAIAPHGTIRMLDQATYRENITINDQVRHEGITIDGSNGATLTSLTPTRPCIEVNGVNAVQLRKLKISISDSEHAVMVTGGAEGTRLESLQITQPNSRATAALQIFGANSDQDSADLVITDCDIESHLTGQSVWIHAEPTPVYNLVVTRNRFRSRGKSTLFVIQGCVRHAVIEENQFEGGHIGLNLNATPTAGPAVHILGNAFYRCDSWMGLMSTKPASIAVALTNNLILECPSVDINDQQLAEVLKNWTVKGNCWERDPAVAPANPLLTQLADFIPEIIVKSRKENEIGFLQPVDPPNQLVPIKKSPE